MSVERLRDDERGFAVLTAVMLTTVLMLFTMSMLATGVHLTTASVRDRNWNSALQVAEAGVDRAVYELSKDTTYTGTGTGVLDVPGGQVQVLAQSPSPGYLTVWATGWVPSRTATNAVARRIRVTFAPAEAFEFALFSETGLFVKNNAGIYGDVFANEGVETDNNAQIYGDVISATEGVQISNNAVVHATDGQGGDVYSGGPAGIQVDNNAIVEGSAFAQAQSCTGSPGSGEYGITATGTVQGDAVAWGSISGSVLGSRTPSNCQTAQATRTLPTYTWDASLYTGETEYLTTALWTVFKTANTNNMSGVHRVWVPSCSSDPTGALSKIDLGGVTITDDFVLVTNCRVDMDNNVTVSAADDAIVNIIVLNDSTDPPAIYIKNNFTVANDPAVLVYASGLIEVKNNGDTNGGVYAGAISIKNNLDITYDDRINRTIGFGDLKYERQAWVECRPSTINTDC
jgi:hypothetical protein